MSNSQSGWGTWHYRLLWIIAVSSLLLNAIFFAGFMAFRFRAQQAVERVSVILDAVKINNFDLPVVVDESLPIDIVVPFNDTFQVPISATIPVSTSVVVQDSLAVPINDVVRIDRDITVSILVLGQPVPIVVPLRADIPIRLDLEIPLDLEVPIQTDIPVDLMVEVPVQSEVPIVAEVPVKLEFPVTIPLDEFGFNILLQQVKDGLNILAEILGVDTSNGK